MNASSTMNHYETSLIISTQITKPKTKEILDKTKAIIQQEGGTIVHQVPQEIRQLAYPIQKQEQGLYQIIEFKAPSSTITKLEILFKRTEAILRFLSLRLDKHGIAYNEEKRKNPKKVTPQKEELPAKKSKATKEESPAPAKSAPAKVKAESTPAGGLKSAFGTPAAQAPSQVEPTAEKKEKATPKEEKPAKAQKESPAEAQKSTEEKAK